MNKIEIKNTDLINGLKPLQSIIREKHIIPILETVHILVTKTNITFTGSNQEISCANTIEHNSDVEFEACVPFGLLTSLINNIKEQIIELTFGDNSIVSIKHSKGFFELPKFEGIDFVFPPKEIHEDEIILKGSDLKSTLKVANKFILNSDLEAVANVLIAAKKEIVIIRSTNKITLFQEQLEGQSNNEKELLISPASSIGLADLISENEVKLRYNDNFAFISDGNKEIHIVLQNGDFPSDMFDKIINSVDDSDEFKINNDDLKSSLKRISMLANREKSNCVRFDLSEKDVELSCSNEAFSTKGNETLEANFKEEKSIGFDAKLLIEVLNVFGNNVELGFNNQNCLCLKHNNKKGLIAPVLL